MQWIPWSSEEFGLIKWSVSSTLERTRLEKERLFPSLLSLHELLETVSTLEILPNSRYHV